MAQQDGAGKDMAPKEKVAPQHPGKAPSQSRAEPPSGPWRYAALDLGTNNCRLLLAEPSPRGFRVLGSYSRIVRLGEGLSLTGRLSHAAMNRTLEALRACAQKVAVHPRLRLRCIATQACRIADNGAEFVAQVKRETGLALEIVTPEEEARLSVLGCAALIDTAADVALVVDIGGGSTELSWVAAASARADPVVLAWTSLSVGVVTLADRMPETTAPGWYDAMVAMVEAEVRAFTGAAACRPAFDAGRAHIVGTSGTVSSLAGVHLALVRYQRSRIDGLWMALGDVRAAAHRLRDLPPEGRAAHPCIGADRADLVAPGAAILEAVCNVWPVARIRVADRGLREGVLLELMRHD